MKLFRLQNRKYAIDNSEGAALFGGRWNNIGTPVIYASEKQSLAVLEVIAHLGAIPENYQFIQIECPDAFSSAEVVDAAALPLNWQEESSGYEMTAAFGTRWAQERRTVILKVPSAIISQEYNFVINPAHPDFANLEFRVADSQRVDPRLRTRHTLSRSELSNAKSPAVLYQEVGVASIGLRVLAGSIDMSISLAGLVCFCTFSVALLGKWIISVAILPYYIVLLVLLLILYHALFCVANTDTFGVRSAGLRIVTFEGFAPTRRQRLSRLACGIISSVPLGIGLLWSLVDEETLCWHDHMSATFPARER
jgi:RES domain-containing protein/uncharacterized RDD family membrane protein YckC